MKSATLVKLYFICTSTMPRVFWACQYVYRDKNFNKSIGKSTIRQTDQQKLWLYLATFQCQTTKLSYKIIRYEEWTVIKLIKVKKNNEVFKNLGSFLGCPYWFNGMKICLDTTLCIAYIVIFYQVTFMIVSKSFVYYDYGNTESISTRINIGRKILIECTYPGWFVMKKYTIYSYRYRYQDFTFYMIWIISDISNN